MKVENSMKNTTNTLFMLFALTFILSCAGNHTENKNMFTLVKPEILSCFPKQIEPAISDSVNLEELNILRAISVVRLNSLFVFSNFGTSSNVSIFNKHNRHVTEAVNTGDGPKEVASYIFVRNNRKNRFVYADRIRKKLFSLNCVNDEITITEELQMDDAVRQLFCLVELNSETLIGTGFFTEGRFIVYNKTNHRFFYDGIYPENEAIKNISPRHKAVLYNGSRTGIHPDGKKFAIMYCGLLDIYEQISETEIKHTKANHYFFPKFTTNETGPAIVYGRDTRQGFLDISCDDQYIYLLYSDKTYEDLQTGVFCGNMVTVFDWNGNPLEMYRLNRNVRSLSVEKDTIWAIDSNYSTLYKYVKNNS
jgi:hypothetical protein